MLNGHGATSSEAALIASPWNKTAPSPFSDKDTADLVLHSSDDDEFYVFKTVLVLASDFFKLLLSLPQPDTVGTDRPILALPEDSQTLEALLRFCYPVERLKMGDLSQLDRVLKAAIKYEVTIAIDALRQQLCDFVEAKPREAFGIACYYSLEQEARIAAGKCIWKVTSETVKAASRSLVQRDFLKTIAGAVFVPEMAHMSSGAYFRLLRILYAAESDILVTLRRRKSEDTGQFEQSLSLLTKRIDAMTKETVYFCKGQQSAEKGGLESNTSRTDWRNLPPFNSADTDIVLRSCEGVDFPVHTTILGFAGAEELLNQAHKVDVPADSKRALHVDIDSETLGPLLMLCYPATLTQMPFSSRSWCAAIEAAVRYGMAPLIRSIRMNWNDQYDHLSMYLIAARLGWTPEAEKSRGLLLDGLDGSLEELYSPELERTAALHYHRLLEYHHSRKISQYDRSPPQSQQKSSQRSSVGGNSPTAIYILFLAAVLVLGFGGRRSAR